MTTQAYADYTAVLADAGAKPCVRCGKRAAVHTQVSHDNMGAPGAGRRSKRNDHVVWVCFECGHEEAVGH